MSAPIPKAGPRAIREFLAAFMLPGEVYELRLPETRRGPARLFGKAAGYVDTVDDAVRVLAPITGQDAAGVYITLNPVKPVLLARAHNRLENSVKATASDADILCRRHLLIDTDPVRPAGVSATDEEVQRAVARRDDIQQYLTLECGWPAPVAATMSGNGGALIYCIDLPNDDAATELVRRVLAALDALFSDEHVTVDAGNYNAARLTKVIGSVAAKGDHFTGQATQPDRPWRVATATYAGNPHVVSAEQLTAVALHAPEDEPQPQSAHKAGSTSAQRTWTMDDLLRLNGLTAVERAFPGGKKYVVDCLTSEDHTDDAALFEIPFCLPLASSRLLPHG